MKMRINWIQSPSYQNKNTNFYNYGFDYEVVAKMYSVVFTTTSHDGSVPVVVMV
jgi:hypothetical protein